MNLRAPWAGSDIPRTTWALRPAPAAWAGRTMIFTDIAGGSLWMSNGAGWAPVGAGVLVLAQSAVAVTAPADTNENILVSISIPAGLIGPNGALRLLTLWSFTNSASTKTLRHRLGGTGIFTTNAASQASANLLVTPRNRGAQNAQVTNIANAGFGFSTSSPTVSTIDTAVGVVLTLTGQKTLGSESLTLESYLVELLRSPNDA